MSLSTPPLVNPKPVSFVCARFLPVCAVERNIATVSPFKHIKKNLLKQLLSTPSKSFQNCDVCLCSICTCLCRYDEHYVFFPSLDKHWIRDSDVTLHPTSSKSSKPFVCARFCAVLCRKFFFSKSGLFCSFFFHLLYLTMRFK